MAQIGTGQAGFDCGAYLQVGLFFMQKPATWWWLAEQLLLQAVAAGRRCKTDGGRREAIARYVYGSFLLDQLEDAPSAHKQLEAARRLSAGRDWVSERDMGIELDSVFAAASLRLHDATVALIKQTRPNDPRGAVRLSKVAVRRVKGRGWRRQECEALLELAVSLEVWGDPREALSALHRYASLAGPAPPPPQPERQASTTRPEVADAEADAAGRCTASLIAAICHLRLGNAKLTETWLERFLEDATMYGLDEMVAAGHRYIGEFYLSQDYATEAEQHLVQAFTLYYEEVASGAHDAATVGALEQTRQLAGIATAQEHLPELQDTILACTGHRPPALALLLRWRDIRAPFWRPFRVPAGSKFHNLHGEGEGEDGSGDEEQGESPEAAGGGEQGGGDENETPSTGDQEQPGDMEVMHVTTSQFSTESLTNED
ncbi:uncharacterized protein LOC126335686 [Schistocerca gregaria]|uniref:uncharacterized protein LOC126335686 n=1 Tax=Schistocerca gregaria TaxID=7010 RepID=UPI00211ED650|nr:uncharacterized protein LOC126335686 [Schistocerca gregaria]